MLTHCVLQMPWSVCENVCVCVCGCFCVCACRIRFSHGSLELSGLQPQRLEHVHTAVPRAQIHGHVWEMLCKMSATTWNSFVKHCSLNNFRDTSAIVCAGCPHQLHRALRGCQGNDANPLVLYDVCEFMTGVRLRFAHGLLELQFICNRRCMHERGELV